MSTKIIKGATDRFNRQTVPTTQFSRDFDSIFSQYDASKILGLSRGLYYNNPIVKSCIEQKAGYTVGSAYEYRNNSTDEEFRKASNKAMSQWSKICEVSGLDLNSLAYQISVKLDVDGDLAVLLTKTIEGYPQVQLISAHAIGSREYKIEHSKNVHEQKGVLYDVTTKRPIKYRILGETEKKDVIVNASDIVFIKEPNDSLRGIPLVSSAINMLYDLDKSQELILTQQLLAASVSMIEHNESGKNEYDLSGSTDSNGMSYEVVNSEGGEVRYFKAGTDSTLEFLTSQNPHTNWQAYQETLTNTAVLALDWSKNLLGLGSGTGVADRLSIQICSKAVEDRQSLLYPFLSRICNYALSVLLKNGYVQFDGQIPEDFYKCSFTKSRKLTVDFARDGKQVLEEYKSGLKNLSQILAEEGIDYETHIRERMTEEAIRIKLKAEIEAAHNVKIDDDFTRFFTPTQFQATSKPNEQ